MTKNVTVELRVGLETSSAVDGRCLVVMAAITLKMVSSDDDLIPQMDLLNDSTDAMEDSQEAWGGCLVLAVHA